MKIIFKNELKNTCNRLSSGLILLCPSEAQSKGLAPAIRTIYRMRVAGSGSRPLSSFLAIPIGVTIAIAGGIPEVRTQADQSDWLPGSPAPRLPGFPASRLPGFPAPRLPHYEGLESALNMVFSADVKSTLIRE